MGRNRETLLRDFHQARWDEEFIMEMSVPGERGILVPGAEEEIRAEIGDGLAMIPEGLRRKTPPALPEVGQMRVLRHFMRLSQETLGADVAIDIGEGTCTMKYSPKVQEHLAARHPGITEIHPLQDDDTIQGILEIYYKMEQFLKEISGLDHFSLQPSSGSQAIYANACVIRAYHAARGDHDRNEIITTIFSHPVDAAAPATAGRGNLRGFVEKGCFDDREKINDIQQRTGQYDSQKDNISRLYGTDTQKPLADKTDDGWHPAHSDGTNGECDHGDRHLFTDAGHLTDLFLARHHHNRTGAQKKRYFHKSMEGNMDHGPFDARGTQ